MKSSEPPNLLPLPPVRHDGVTPVGTRSKCVDALAVGPRGEIMSSHSGELVYWAPDGPAALLNGEEIHWMAGNEERWVCLTRRGHVLELQGDGSVDRWFVFDEPWALALHPNGELYVGGGSFNNVLTFDGDRDLVGAVSLSKYVMSIHPIAEGAEVAVCEWIHGPGRTDAHTPPEPPEDEPFDDEDDDVDDLDEGDAALYDSCHSDRGFHRADLPHVGFVIDAVPLLDGRWLVASDSAATPSGFDAGGCGLWLCTEDEALGWKTGMITKLAQREDRVVAGSLSGAVYLLQGGAVVAAWKLPEGESAPAPGRESLNCDTYDWRDHSVTDLAFRGDRAVIVGTAGGSLYEISLDVTGS